MRINFNGIIGLFAIGVVIFIIISRQGNVNWIYIIGSSAVYLSILLGQHRSREDWVGPHLYFACIVASIFLADPIFQRYQELTLNNNSYASFDVFRWVTYILMFLVSISLGLLTPVLILSGYSMLAIPLSIIILISAFNNLNKFTVSEWMPVHYSLAAIIICTWGSCWGVMSQEKLFALGFCFVLVFLTIGIWVNLESLTNYLFFIAASFILGLTVPFLIFRKAS
jgi:hypothetical protein